MLCYSLDLPHYFLADKSVDYIFISFGTIEPIVVILKIEYRFSQCYGAYAASHEET